MGVLGLVHAVVVVVLVEFIRLFAAAAGIVLGWVIVGMMFAIFPGDELITTGVLVTVVVVWFNVPVPGLLLVANVNWLFGKTVCPGTKEPLVVVVVVVWFVINAFGFTVTVFGLVTIGLIIVGLDKIGVVTIVFGMFVFGIFTFAFVFVNAWLLIPVLSK